jgi:uncharacterized membrane protein
MQKSRLGLPAAVVAVLMYLSGLFGGFIPALLVGGYILLCEEENFIRRAAVKTLLVLFVCALVNFLIYLIPDVVGIVQSLLAIFKVHFSTAFLDNASSALSGVMDLIKTIFLIVLAVMACFGKSIDLKPVNKLSDK